MNRSPKWASGPAGKARRNEVVFDLGTAKRMLPLVSRIVHDIQESRTLINRLQPEQDRLERHRRDLSWPERRRRYAVQEELAAAERRLSEIVTELGRLGVALLPDREGEIGFPTELNGRSAFYLWRDGETDVTAWNYAGESLRRTIPPEWLDTGAVRAPRRR
jgi:hypothetical protein